MRLLLATYFTLVGILRIIAALGLRPPRWEWAAGSGLITLILGTR